MPFKFVYTAVSSLVVLLSLWLFVGSWSVHSKQGAVQSLQEKIQARQLAIQSQQQQIQLQQQRIDSGAQLANQIGPAMLRDLAGLQLQNKNQKIADLLKKYGVEARAEQAPAKPASTPAPTPATPADKKP